MKGKSVALIVLCVFLALTICDAASADTAATNDSTNVSVNGTGNTSTSQEVSGQDCLPTVAHGTINGEVYISSIPNWASKYTTNNFNVPNGTVVYAKYYVGIWMPGTATSTFNGNTITSEAVYPSGMGVTWISYDVTNKVIAGQTNTATSTSTGGDDRQYGSTLVVVLQNETDPLIEYWITEGLDWLNYGEPVDWSNTTFAGTLDRNTVQNASLYSIHLTGYNYEDFNGYTLPTPTQHLAGDYFDALRWDNIQNLLVAENQKVNVGRGSDTYTSVVFHALTITYKEDAPDIVPVNLTPTIVDPNVINTVTATIENQGKIDATSPFNVSLLVDGTVVDTQTVTSLASGNSTTVNFQWTPVGTKNTYNLTVIVDPENSVAEYREDNNMLNLLIGTSTASKPVAEFTANTTSGNEPLTTNFTDQSTNEPTSWFWDFGDGTSSTDQNPTHPYTLPGVYNVTLSVTNAGGSSSKRKTNYITVNAVTPVAAFTTNNTSVTTPSTIQFTDTSTHCPTSWFWEFGDGTTSTEQNPTHTYTSPGIYTVKLAAINSAGFDTEEKTNYITAYITPVANFTAATTSGGAPFTVTFSDKSTNSPTEWLWDFGDGTTSTSQNPTHTYINIGSYTVTLTATNVAGSNTTTKIGYIITSASTGPVWTAISAWNAPDIGNYAAPCLVDLDGDGDYDLLIGASTGVCYGYENTGNATSPVWTAKSAWNTPDIGSGNNYAVPCLVDLDGDGDYDLLIGEKAGVCYGYENTGNATSPFWTAKSAWNSPDVGSYAAPCLVDLDGDGDYDLLIGAYDGITYAYENTGNTTSPVWTAKPEWNAPNVGSYAAPCLADLNGDGGYDILIGAYTGVVYGYENTGNATSPVWTAKSAWNTPDIGNRANPALADLDGDGDYDLLIGATDGIGYAYENTAITGNPDLTPTSVVSSTINPGTPCNVTAVISNNGTADVGAFVATLSVDGVVVDTQSVLGPVVGGNSMVNFTWTPIAPGNYNITVTADSNNRIDESDETNNNMTVSATVVEIIPVAEFSADVTSGDPGLTVNFTDESSNAPTSWLWNFGDGTTSTEQNPTHTYTKSGTYTVTLTSANTSGSNSTTKTGYITVYALTLVAGFTANSTTGTGPFTVQFTDQTTYESTHMPTSWFWEFGDGATSTEQNPIHTYTSGAKYTVKLLAMNEFGLDSESKTNYITVYMMPVADFTSSTTSGSFPVTVTFTDKSSNLPTEWLWDFGDGTTSTSQNPTHAYTSVGTYTVTLTATNIVGSNTSTKTGYITITQPIGPKWSTPIQQTADIGSCSNPIWADLDGDGDYDLLIGEKAGVCYAYENTGTTSSPVWTAKSTWNTPSIGTYANPAFADLDGDDDYDLLIGAYDGITYAYENTGNTTSPVWTAKPEWNAPNVGSYAAPCLADLDGDGDYDLLIGANDGVTYAYENTGNTTSPVWTAKPEWNVEDIGDSSSPCLGDLDGDGDYDMLIGAVVSPGHVYAYENTGNATSPVWTAKPAWDTPYYFTVSAPCLGDIDGDGDNDALIGWQTGDAYYIRNDGTLLSTNPDLTPTSVDVPSSIIAGIPCTVSAVISNNGKLNVGAFVATLSVDGVVVDTQSVIGPSVGNTSTVNFTWTPDSVGDHTLVVTVDSIYGITESDETNNNITEDVNVKAPPVAEFTADNTNVTTLDSVQFTDMSNNLPTSWQWDFGDGATSTEQNPTHTYTTPGTYTVKLTTTNDIGNDTVEKIDYITVMNPYDLVVSGNVDVVPTTKNTVFAKETNPVKVTVVNNGSGTATNIVVALYASDVSGTVPVATVTIDSLVGGSSTTIEIIDPTIRNLEGGTVIYTVKLDPDNLIPETNETNNAMDSTVKSVKYNGYKGKQYWECGSNVTTQRTYDIYGDMVYSKGDSSYRGGGWNDYTVTWSEIQPTIPSTASIAETWLYVAYTWDETGLVPNNLTLTFNGHVLNYVNLYVDQANFGTYANYKYGLLTYNVTEFYNKNGVNTLFLDRNGNSSIAMYPCNLMVIYEDTNSTRKQIFINEEADLLGFSPTSYGTTLDEATAYVPFTGMVIDTSKVKNATLYSSAGNAGPDEGNFIWNGSLITSNAWNGTSTGVFTLVKDVTSYLTSTGNVAGIQSTNSGGMAALQQILVVEYAPDLVVTNITVNKGSGDNWFANEPNILTINVTNQGGSTAPESTLNIDVNGTTYTVNVPALAAGSSTTVTVTDPTSRTSGDNVPVSAATDPSNSIPETNETNNSYSVTFTVYNNGYKGKRYTNGTDLETNQTFEGNYEVIYSCGNSTYRSGGTGGSAWNNPYTVTWTSTDLIIPEGATVAQVRLYQPYTWNTVGGVPDFVATFNGNVLSYLAHYNDTKGYGTSNYPSGLLVYDVTSYFNRSGNSLTLTKGINTTISLYGGYLVVVYQDANATYKKIYINDGTDLLCSSNSFSVNDTEATAYATYNNVNTTNMSGASVVVVMASADKTGQSKFFFNGNMYSGFWSDYTGNSGSQTGFSVYNVFSNIQNGSNLAGIQSYNNGTTGDNMVALSSILIVTYDTTAPTVNATPMGGLFNATQTVTLTALDDQDSNPIIYYTTDGTTPTNSSTVYTGPITVSSTTTLRFFAVDKTGNAATVQTEGYTIDTTSPGVSASPTGGLFNSTKTVTLQATDNLDTNPVIYYTTDGTIPTTSSSVYVGPITIDTTTTVRFFAVDDAGNVASVQSETYTIDMVVPEVSANPVGGLFNTTQTVTLHATDNLDTNPVIYYTIDGTTPTSSSSVYTGPITVSSTTTLRFFAVDDVGNISPVQSQTYTIDSTAPVVTANPEGGIFNTSKTVTITATDNLDTNPVIYYTIDGTTPTTSSTVYTGPITIDTTTIVRFFAVDDAGNSVPVQSQTYTIDSIAPMVTADLSNGTYDTVQSVNLTATDNLDTSLDIYYTIDGSTPTTASTKYTGPVVVDRAMTLSFVAVDDAGNFSPVGSRSYDVKSDVYVQVTPSVESPRVGDTVEYTFKLGNNGPGVATDVVFTYQIPDGMEYAGVTVDAGDNRDANGTLHSGVVSYDPATRTITWTFDELYKCDPWLYLNLRVITHGTYIVQPTLTTSNYNPGLTSRIGSLNVNAVANVSSTGTSNVQAATTTSVQAGTVPMQRTGMPLAGLILGILCVGGGFVLNRKK